jgi:hypothetical protein
LESSCLESEFRALHPYGVPGWNSDERTEVHGSSIARPDPYRPTLVFQRVSDLPARVVYERHIEEANGAFEHLELSDLAVGNNRGKSYPPRCGDEWQVVALARHPDRKANRGLHRRDSRVLVIAKFDGDPVAG